MGIGGISIWQLLIILLIVVLLFGTKKLRNMGGDLGNAIKNFRQSVRDANDDKDDTATTSTETKTDASPTQESAPGTDRPARIIDAEANYITPKSSTAQTSTESHDPRSV